MKRELTNSEVLAWGESHRFLTGLDRQRLYLLRIWSAQRACPSCGTKQNYFEASGKAIDDVEFVGPEPKFTCITEACKRELIHTVPFFGDWHWTLVPIKLA